jgi:hypothetical protein
MDNITRAYLECAIWSEFDDTIPFDRNYTVDDFSPEAVEQATEDCRRFQEENANDLDEYNCPHYITDELAGSDLWLTRNRHGSGFWDRTSLPESVKERLTNAAHALGECHVYINDGRLELA